MGKKALAVLRKDIAETLQSFSNDEILLKSVYNPEDGEGGELYFPASSSSVFRAKSYLLDRGECETNPEYLQLIPYVTFITDGADGSDGADGRKILVYERGKAGDENRLHAKFSIGVGGHVDDAVGGDTTLLDVITENLVREIKEEIGINLNDWIENIHDLFYEAVVLVYSNDTVGSVHLGLSFLTIVPEALLDEMIAENNVINNLQLIPATTEAFENIELEAWSQLVFNNLIDMGV